MFTPFDSHLPAAVRTGLAHACKQMRGWVQDGDASLARRMAP